MDRCSCLCLVFTPCPRFFRHGWQITQNPITEERQVLHLDSSQLMQYVDIYLIYVLFLPTKYRVESSVHGVSQQVKALVIRRRLSWIYPCMCMPDFTFEDNHSQDCR